jgi:hypothetical protein
MNTQTITTTSLYCPGCDSIVNHPICVRCNEYKLLTVTEAIESGWLMSLAPLNCTCDICTL